MLIRLCKIALVMTMAIFFAVVAFDNIIDYETNRLFVQHVLAMDTIFPDSRLRWRAITDPGSVSLAYWAIIAWQMVVAALLIYASARMTSACTDLLRFSQTKAVAILGLTCGLLLYGLGITVVGGEWFAMWQSKIWNGLDSAARFILLDGVVLVALLAPED